MSELITDFIEKDFMNAITSPTIIVTFLIVAWFVYFVVKRHYKWIIEAKDETIKNRDELLVIAGISDILHINIQSPMLTKPYAQALSSLIKDEVKQILIALNTIKKPIPIDSGFEYNLKLGSKHIKGIFESLEIIKEQLKKTQLLECNPSNNTIKLTKLGTEFVDWLIKDGQRALYFHSKTLGSWGILPESSEKTNTIIHCAPLKIEK